MQNDKTTLKDISIFASDADVSVFTLLDHTVTHVGRSVLKKHIQNPPDNLEQLLKTQEVIKYWTSHSEQWPKVISNGTIVMLEKFFETADNVSTPPTGLNLILGSTLQKVFNRNEYHFTQFSLSHISDFVKGCKALIELKGGNLPQLLKSHLDYMEDDLSHPLVDELLKINKDTPYKTLITLGYKVRRELKNPIERLVGYYAKLDAWHSLALATHSNQWSFPTVLPMQPAVYQAKGLYHPLLKKATPYDIDFKEGKNLLLLTGANMSGKTTFMRALGVTALLAHLGAGVPAKELTISFLKGIITNMHVEDNILKGESYFLAEVMRMKNTASRLLQEEPHLVLMDELFKGTNVHDAYECTKAVVEGLAHRKHHIMVLSTHLYEVAQYFKDSPDMFFSYFTTDMKEDGSYDFKYQLKAGISNDRIGYRILQQEGVIDMLKKDKT